MEPPTFPETGRSLLELQLHSYSKNSDYRRNVSLCGPTSIVNVLRSLHQLGDQAIILEGTAISRVMDYLPGA